LFVPSSQTRQSHFPHSASRSKDPVKNANGSGGKGKRLADLGKIVGSACDVVVNCVRNGTSEQKDVCDHFTLLPALFEALQLAHLFREMAHHFPNRGKCVQSPGILAIEVRFLPGRSYCQRGGSSMSVRCGKAGSMTFRVRGEFQHLHDGLPNG